MSNIVEAIFIMRRSPWLHSLLSVPSVALLRILLDWVLRAAPTDNVVRRLNDVKNA